MSSEWNEKDSKSQMVLKLCLCSKFRSLVCNYPRLMWRYNQAGLLIGHCTDCSISATIFIVHQADTYLVPRKSGYRVCFDLLYLI